MNVYNKIVKMKKISNFLLLLLIFPIVAFSQEVSPVKNVIVMIPDGTSLTQPELQKSLQGKF
jgi:alkaline phosphatase